MSYQEWMKKVDELCWEHLGVSIHDLGDFCSRDLYGDELSPEEGFMEALLEQDMMDTETLTGIADKLGVDL